MLDGQTYYHGTVRGIIVAFGRMFSEIYIQRRQGDSVTGNLVQTIHVPLAYAAKEKWIQRLEQNPTLDNEVYVTLPRLSFEIVGYLYDTTRKLNRMQTIQCGVNESQKSMVRTPAPYNISINLYLLTKTTEDALQVVEQILPTFTPEYSLQVKVLPEMNVIQTVPIILDTVSVQDEYSGDFQTRRLVTYTFGFTLKANLYGPVTTGGIITDITSSIKDPTNNSLTSKYSLSGDPTTGQITNETWIDEL